MGFENFLSDFIVTRASKISGVASSGGVGAMGRHVLVPAIPVRVVVWLICGVVVEGKGIWLVKSFVWVVDFDFKIVVE